MGERKSRFVFVCECREFRGQCMQDDGFESSPWLDDDVDKVCWRCHQPVQAINIDRLLMVEGENQLMRLELDRAINEIQAMVENDPDEVVSDRGDKMLTLWRHYAKATIRRARALLNHSGTPNSSSRCDGSCADWDAECGGGCDE